jgi:putative methyltransferase (TIGR04325 family)
MNLKNIAKLVLPPIILELAKKVRTRVRNTGQVDKQPSIEYVPQGWEYAVTNAASTGWDEDTIIATQKRKWHRFRELVADCGPLGFGHEGELENVAELSHHNIHMVFAYCACLASRNLDSMSLLDWGGGLGQYYLLAESLLPDVRIDYTCKELPKAVECGADLLPSQRFVSDNSYQDRSYDFVLASSSLNYSEQWKTVLHNLARVTRGYLLVTRLPVVEKVPAFVFVHRPYETGYYTEYLAWCLNRREFLETAQATGLHLVREFATGENIEIHMAPEKPVTRGFLFKLKTNH